MVGQRLLWGAIEDEHTGYEMCASATLALVAEAERAARERLLGLLDHAADEQRRGIIRGLQLSERRDIEQWLLAGLHDAAVSNASARLEILAGRQYTSGPWLTAFLASADARTLRAAVTLARCAPSIEVSLDWDRLAHAEDPSLRRSTISTALVRGVPGAVGPGSLDVKFEGRNVQLLGDPMINNCGPSGSPANAATLAGVLQEILAAAQSERPNTTCHSPSGHVWQMTPPAGSKPLADKISDAKSAPVGTGTHFEGLAAEHNRASGDLRRSDQLSDPNDTREKIWWKCTVCGLMREGDQTHDGPNGAPPIAVEVKSKPKFNERDARQLGVTVWRSRMVARAASFTRFPSAENMHG